MKKLKLKYQPSKKPKFYCDEDFPKPSLDKLKRFKVQHSVLDFEYQGRDDTFHFEFAFKEKSILLTLDEDYLDNRRFKLNKTFGVIIIIAGKRPTWERVNEVMDKLLPLLKNCIADSLQYTKIRASLEGYVKVSLEDGQVIKREFRW